MASTIQLQRTIQRSQQMIRLSPLTFSAIGTVAINVPGTAYTPGDVVKISGGLQGSAQVTSVTGGGATGPVGGLILLIGGEGYFSAQTGAATTGGTGNGLTVNTTTTNNDPAFSNADWVMQEILAPPLAWRWNRVGATPQVPTFTTQIGVSDYSVSLSNFGWLEKGTAYDPNSGNAGIELQVGLLLSAETLPNQPARIAAVFDDGAGNITFRVFPSPDKIYKVVVEYQKSATLFTSTTQTWAPIPDYFSYIYNTGFDFRAYEYFGDARSQSTGQLFYTQLANAAEGLESSQKNIWLADKLNSLRQTQNVQQGRL